MLVFIMKQQNTLTLLTSLEQQVMMFMLYDIPVTMCLHYYHVGVFIKTAEQIDTIDLTRTTGNDVYVIRYTSNYVFTLLPYYVFTLLPCWCLY